MSLSKIYAYNDGMVDVLGKLFGSSSRIKIIRFFFLNSKKVFTAKEISRRTQVGSAAMRREILCLEKIDFIKKSSAYEEVAFGRKKTKKKRIRGWILNPLFPLLVSLKNLILNTPPISKVELLKRIRSIGSIKLIILSGIFIQNDESRVDILVVGDNIKQVALEKAINGIEAIVGRELVYTALSTEECLYRLGMYDKFIRDILDYPHEKILNKLNIP